MAEPAIEAPAGCTVEKPLEQGGRGHRVRSLDGLRALAVTAVVLYHYPTSRWVPGGWLGVDVFFVLSGYLITGQLLQLRDRLLGATIRDFYRRRARRLLPALAAVLAVWLTAVLLAVTGVVSVWPVASPTVGSLGGILVMLVAAVGISQNWLQALHPSDAATFSPTWSIGNLWTLCVEEQFYLIWPLFALRLSRRALAVLTGVLGLASILVPLVVHRSSAQRFYFGTDVRCIALLAGAALAQVAHLVPRTRELRRLMFFLASIAGLGLLIEAHSAVDAAVLTRPFVYAEIAGLAVAVVAACALFDPAGFLCWRPLQWLGHRSYAVYLWQAPFGAWFVPRGPWWCIAGVVGTLIAADLSWRLVETRWNPRRVSPVFGGRR